MSLRSKRRTFAFCAVGAICLLTACPRERNERGDGGTSPNNKDGGSDPNAYMGNAGNGSGNGTGGGKCQQTSKAIEVRNVDKVDLLLVVDNSSTMAAEQQSLKAALPNLIKVLTTGFRHENDPNPFPPVKDLHVGIVSTDMGTPGVEASPACHADGGDDGKLQNAAHGDNCDAQYPQWLTFLGDARIGSLTDPNKFANDIGCVATLGTGGCDFEQQLEAPFKALMPKLLTDVAGNVSSSPYRFLSTTEPGTHGRGDMPVAQGGNQGFLRNAITEGQSLIAITLITDEEDCSVKSTNHLLPNGQLPEDSPYRQEDMNLRCFNHPEFMYDIEKRYLAGFRALRPGNPELVVFAAIAGVPPDLVDQAVLSKVDFGNTSSRDQFYTNILSDERMVAQIDPATNPGSGTGNIKPSCLRPGNNAYPPRRIVQLASLFGENGIVQSICEDDFGPALSAVTNIIGKNLGEKCLSNKLTRQNDGLVPCEIIWELPRQAAAGSAAPVSCEQLPYLTPVANQIEGDRIRCKVNQLPVTNPASKMPPEGEGWFYDDHTEDLAKSCTVNEQQRIGFSSSAKPPLGVLVKLECKSPLSSVSDALIDTGDQRVGIGNPCGKYSDASPYGDEVCAITWPNGDQDASRFCHPTWELCVKSCSADADCPAGWKCNNSPEALAGTSNRAFCIDPKCNP